MKTSLVFALAICFIGCGQNPSPPGAVEPKPQSAALTTTSQPERPKSLTEQVEQLRDAKLLLAQHLTQTDRMIEEIKADDEKFRKAAAMQAIIDKALKKPSTPDVAKALEDFKSNLARLEKKRAELKSEIADNVERLLKEGEERLAAGNDQRLDVPPALERWLKSNPIPGKSGTKPATTVQD